MGKIVMPKNSALLEEIEPVLKIYYEANDWISNDEYKAKLKTLIGSDQYASSYTKKSQITSYFGFTIWQDRGNSQSLRKITESGKLMYEALQAKDTETIQSLLMEALETVKFGRSNYGCPESNSDVDPPTLFVRAILDLGYLTYKEFAWLLWKLEDLGANYTDSIVELSSCRKKGQIDLGKEAQKYADCKPIMILVRWGFLAEDKAANANNSNEKRIIIAKSVLQKFQFRLRNLKIYNIDKDIYEENTSESESEDNEKRFRIWLSKQITVNGKPATPGMISNNCSALKKVCKLMEIIEYPDLESIFDITDIDIFVDVKNIITLHSDYHDVNVACNGRYLSTGLKWYEKYLNEIELATDTEGKATNTETINIERINYDVCERLSTGANILLYGVPGSGKSYTIANEYCKGVPEDHIQRVVFHPDYSYSDFIGQILPTITKRDGSDSSEVIYDFTPGPFTRIVKDAYLHPTEKYVLVIEELNRGNAPAIFGEMFQLLDRKREGSPIDDGLQIGSSEYGITNKDVASVVYGTEDHKVYIPSNLEILATMNTSDQNVFTLDTAFQRRWQMRLLENSFDTVKTSLAEAKILDTSITWRRFCTSVNDMIINGQSDIASSEDKRLGVYFVAESDLDGSGIELSTDAEGRVVPLEKEYKTLLKKKADEQLSCGDADRLTRITDVLLENRKFPEKVIKYLWDDAFRFNREEFFRNDMTSLEKVVSTFIFATGDDKWKKVLSGKALKILGLNNQVQ